MLTGFKYCLIVPLTVIFFFLPQVSTLQGQGTTATVSGTVQDETGGVLPGVYITVDEVDTGTTRSAVTDDAGRYRVPLLEPGTYEIRAELSGFRTAVRTGVKLAVGANALIDLSLTIGEITERVVVQGEAPLVETTTSSMTGLVDDKKIRDLPLNGRSYEQLALLQTGVSTARFSSTGSANGSVHPLLRQAPGLAPTISWWTVSTSATTRIPQEVRRTRTWAWRASVSSR